MGKDDFEEDVSSAYEGCELIAKPGFNLIKIDEIPEFTFPDLTVPNDTKRVKKLTNFVRKSKEYYRYMHYLKKHLDFTRCAFLKNVSTKIRGVSIEIHHSPFTLFDITMAVTNKHISLYGKANEFNVSDEVMLLHFKNEVGLIPVSTSVHELIHSQAIDVHPKYTYGFWRVFCEEYKEYFSEEMLLKYNDLIKFAETNDYRIPDILKVKYTVISLKGAENFGSMESVTDKNRLLIDVDDIMRVNVA